MQTLSMDNFLIIRRSLPRLFGALMLGLITSGGWATDSNTKEPILDWQVWSPAVFGQARNEERLVLLDLVAEWCQFCRKMDQTTYLDPRVIDVIKHNYIPVRADQDAYPELAKRYEDYGRPATVIFDGNGTELIKREGYLRPQWMVWLLEAVAQNPSPEAHR
ncbi:MAG: DUF255 domain-containing protein [Gammaproteobacteria bacterium]|nr:DUF255 domain-containing protein [Gammaproteobacteria bacterium]